MAEQFANDAYGYLDGDVDAIQVSVLIQDASGFPLGPEFHLRIDSEILLVTAVNGNEFTVTRGHEGTIANQHYHNSLVIQVLTAEVLENLGGGAGETLVPLLNGSRTDPAIVFTADGDYILVNPFA